MVVVPPYRCPLAEMNAAAAAECLMAADDDVGEAFVVLLSDDRENRHRRPELQPQTSSLPPCLVNRQLPPPSPPSQPPLVTVADAYKTRPRRKDRGAFVVLPEPPAANAALQTQPNATAAAAATGTCSGRVSPFRGNGFKTPENGRSRAASPSSEPLRRQSSEPRISTNRQRPDAKQRLSVSTKDLSKAGKPTTSVNGNKPPPVPATAVTGAVKSSPRKKLPTGPLQLRRVASSKSPTPDVSSPKTPRRPPPLVAKSPAAKPAVNRPPPGKSSPRLPKKRSTVTTTKTNVPPPPSQSLQPSNGYDGTQTQAETTTTSATTPGVSTTVATTSVASTVTTSTSDGSLSSSSATAPPIIAAPVPVTTTPTTAVTATAAPSSSVTASTSATAIATTHATNAVASPVVTGGPIVSAAPPPAAIAANTLLAVNPALPVTPKPPQSEIHARKQLVVVEDDDLPPTSVTETPAVRQSTEPTTTTPPLSYELQEIVVEPEIENQSGRTTTRLTDAKNMLSNNNHNNNNNHINITSHKTVAWARQSDKIIVATDVPRSAEMVTAATTETKYPVYKRFARRLWCNGDGNGPGGKELALAATAVTTDSRPRKCWAAVWKCRPRLSNRWCYGEKKVTTDAGQPQTATTKRTVATKSPRLRWWQRCWGCCAFCGKRNDRKSTSDRASVGVLGISPPAMPPPTSDTFCGKLLRWLTCRGYCHTVPRLFRRACCCRALDAPKKSADKRSLFKCTGCCSNKPAKLDAVLVDHSSSVMKGAIPVLPVILAWFCLVFNVIIPGAGTFSSGVLCLCVGKPRFSVNDNFQSRMGAFCVNLVVAVAQLFTVLFCLVGWGWSIWWGVIMIKMAKKYQKIKVVDQPVEAPIAIDHNHQI